MARLAKGGFPAARMPLALFAVQLGLNVLWSCIFFGLEKPGLAFVEVLLLWAAIAATMVAFWSRSTIAGILFVPVSGVGQLRQLLELHHLAAERMNVMGKQRKTIPTAKNKGRFYLGRRLLLPLVAAVVLALGITKWWPQEKHTKFRTQTQIVAAQEGFDIAEEPNRPGPYEELGTCRAGVGESVIGSFWANGKICRVHVPGVAGEELRVVGLLPQDGGGPTYVVLRRQVASAPPTQSTK